MINEVRGGKFVCTKYHGRVGSDIQRPHSRTIHKRHAEPHEKWKARV